MAGVAADGDVERAVDVAVWLEEDRASPSGQCPGDGKGYHVAASIARCDLVLIPRCGAASIEYTDTTGYSDFLPVRFGAPGRY